MRFYEHLSQNPNYGRIFKPHFKATTHALKLLDSEEC